METLVTYGVLKHGSVSSYICGPDLCKFYSRPLDTKSNPGDVTDIEYESENDEPILRSKKTSGKCFNSVATQTNYRESEAQTDPWDPPYAIKKIFKEPEVLQLKELSYGNGLPVSHSEINYILENRKNKDVDISAGQVDNLESFPNERNISSQVQNEWNYKISKQSEKLLSKLKHMEITLAQELAIKSERQQKLLDNLWTHKKDQVTKMNSKLQKELKKEIKVLEKRCKSGTNRFDAKSYRVHPVSKELALHIENNRESLNRDIDYLLTKYHMNPNGLSKLTNWLERKRTDLYNEVPIAKPVQKNKRERLMEKAYEDLLVEKQTKIPPRVYHEEYDKEESIPSSVNTRVEFEILEFPEEGVDLVTVWQQVLRGRAYQKEMLEMIEKHKDSLDVLLSS